MSNLYPYAPAVSVNQPTYKVEISTADGFIPFTNDVRNIEIQTTCREMSNQFRISFVPREDANADNIYNRIEPMSYVRIQIKCQNDELTTVMRGFVTGVEKSFDISGGTPQRIIVVSGENYGKIIKMYYIHYILALDPPQIFAAGSSRWPLAAGQGIDMLQGKLTPSQFVQEVFDKFLKKTFANVKQLVANRKETVSEPNSSKQQTTQTISSSVDDFLTDIDVAGVDCQRLPTGIPNPKKFHLQLADPSAGSADTSMVEFLTQYYGAPWNEIFIDDAPDCSYLVYRPFPYRDRDGGWVGTTAFNGQDPKYTPAGERSDTTTFIDVLPDEVVSYALARTDEEVFNYFWVDGISTVPGNQYELYSRSKMDNLNPHFTADLQAINPAGDGTGTTVPKSEKLNYSRMELFGYRKFWQSCRYISVNPQELGNTEVVDSIKSPIDDPDFIQVGQQLAMTLFNAMEHNAQLEKGAVVIKGREDIRPGMYITLRDERQDTDGYMYYVTDVFHSLSPYDGNFITRLTVSRGEGHLNQVDDRF